MKKIMLVFFALVVLSLPFQQTYIETNAAVASKVATLSAKKVAKEVVQDIAIETAANFALMQALDIVSEYEAKPGFKIVCPDGSQTCNKPIQVKETLTDSDKTAIKGQAGLELDKMINNGKAIPKWQKFLDWFLPVWLVTFGATVLTYAFDSDVRSLFNETGYNALVALGFIAPIDTKEVVPIKEIVIENNDKTPTPQPADDGRLVFEVNSPVSTSATYYSPNFSNKQSNYVWDLYFHSTDEFTRVGVAYLIDGKMYEIVSSGLEVFVTGQTVDSNSTATLYKNGEYLTHGGPYQGGPRFILNSAHTGIDISPDVSIDMRKLISIRTRMPYQIGDFWYTDILYNTVSGNEYQIQTKTSGAVIGKVDSMRSSVTKSYGKNIHYTGVATPNVAPIKKILPPVYDDFENGEDVIKKSNYEDDKGRVAIIPPAAIPLEEEGTGQQVIRVPSANGDGYEFQKPDGTIVPEENVTTGPDPVVTPSPEGTPTVTPTPTPTVPNPEPIPLTPDATAPPGTPPGTPPAEEPPAEPFPEGEKCDAKLKFPIFSPLKETFSTAFPFSIPWDIGRAIEAGFGGISDEKPAFKISLPFMGESWEINITTPALFDKWKPFTDTFLLLTFDVLIMFGVFRFVKGAGS